MRIFVTGATGYIGGSVAMRLRKAGHQVVGLARSEASATKLRRLGIEPCMGSLADGELLAEEARRADAFVNAASSDNRDVVAAVLPALAGSSKPFVQTSGSSLVADHAEGNGGGKIYDEETPVEPVPERAARQALNAEILAAAGRGVRTIVLCPSLIYGSGTGAHRDSVQVPRLIDLAKQSGIPRHIGRGENIWSHVHIDDLVELFMLALDKAPAGSFFYAENGEASMKQVAQAIGRMLGIGDRTETWPLAEAIESWGRESALFTFASNSRVRAVRARRQLNWQPKGPPLLVDIENGSYRRIHAI
jgi:nucleoside-diphosphate-sugar epimerase